MIENYVSVMEESLKKKNGILDRIAEVCRKQEALLREESFPLEEFDRLMDEKGELAEELEKLDDGFEALYERTGKQLQDEKEKFKVQIRHMQELITEITEKTNNIQTMEERSKQSMEMHLRNERSRLLHMQYMHLSSYDFSIHQMHLQVPGDIQSGKA